MENQQELLDMNDVRRPFGFGGFERPGFGFGRPGFGFGRPGFGFGFGRPFGFGFGRPFGFYPFGFGFPFFGGLLGGLALSSLYNPYYYGYGYPYYPYYGYY